MSTFTVLNPATEEPVAQVEQTSAAAADEAVARAVAVQPAWRKVAPGERAALLRAFADVVEHYANGAKVELAAFDAAVTDWELYRGFERT